MSRWPNRVLPYVETLYPTPRRCLGRSLLPLSIAHCELLERFDSPFAIEAKGSRSVPDVLLAVFICSRTPDAAERAFRSKFTALKLRLWGWIIRYADAVEGCKIFFDYMAAATAWPEWEKEDADGGGEASGIPHLLWLRTLLLSETGLSNEEISRMPYAQAVWIACAVLERTVKGFQIISPERRKAMEEAKRLQTVVAANMDKLLAMHAKNVASNGGSR